MPQTSVAGCRANFRRSPGKIVTTMMLNTQRCGSWKRHHVDRSLKAHAIDDTICSQLPGQPAMTYTEKRTFFERSDIVRLLEYQRGKTRRAHAALVPDDGVTLITYREYQHASAFQPYSDRTTGL